MKTQTKMTLHQVQAIRRQNFGKANGMVQRLAAELEHAMQTIGELRHELTADPLEREAARPDVEHVLVRIEADGFVEVWCKPWVSVRVVHLPNMRQERAADLAEEVVLSRLPRVYRELMDEAPPRASGNVRCCPTYASLRLVQIELDALQVINAMEVEG